MISMNLIPTRRRQQRKLRARRKGWIGAACIYAVLLGGAYVTWRGVWSADDHELADQLAGVQTQIDDATTSINQFRSVVSDARLALEANRSVSGQPDWSMLLALL